MRFTKYTKSFHFKTLKRNDLFKISEIVSKSDDITVEEIKTTRMLKENGILVDDSKSFDNFDDLLNYLNTGIKFLDKVTFILKENDNKIFLEVDEGYFITKWKMYFDEKTLNTEGLIFNLKKVLRFNFFNIHKEFKGILMILLWAISVLWTIILKKLNIISCLLVLLTVFLYLLITFNKTKQYKDNKFLRTNKDSIFLGIVFYILGVITPYIVELIKKIF